MISYDTLVPLAAAELPGCPDSIIKFGLKQAAQDFFQQTELWRVECEAVTVTAGEYSVELDLPMNTMLVAPYQVYVNDAIVSQTHPEQVATSTANWMSESDTTVKGYWVDSPTTVRLYPIPSVNQTLAAYVSVMPKFEAESISDTAYPHLQTLVYGALWKLQSMPGKAWSNDVAAETNGNLFNAGCVQAKIFAVRHGMGSLSVSLRR